MSRSLLSKRAQCQIAPTVVLLVVTDPVLRQRFTRYLTQHKTNPLLSASTSIENTRTQVLEMKELKI